jgi:hypothetical protein
MNQGLATSDIIALASIFVALLAFSSAIWQANLMRKHNKLSVIPLLAISVNMHNKFELTLLNAGLGPAIIKEFSVYFDGKLVALNPREDVYGEILNVLNASYTCYLPFVKGGIPINSNESLLCVEPEIGCYDQVKDLSDRIGIKVVYTSIYGGNELEEGYGKVT